MSGACEIIRYRPEYKDAVAQLQTALWSPDPAANRRYFEWKYEANPWSVEPRIYLALRDGRLVGMRGCYESRWEVGSPAQMVSVPLADDFVVAIGDRKRGVASQILRAAIADLADSGIDYVFSLSAGMVTMMGSLALGWKSAGRVDPLVRREPSAAPRVRERISRMPVLWRWANAPILRSAAERRPFRALDTASSREPSLAIAREPRPEAMAELVAELGHDGRLRHVRSREYLAWRFVNPMHDYRFLYATRGGRLAGYLVLRARDEPPADGARLHRGSRGLRCARARRAVGDGNRSRSIRRAGGVGSQPGAGRARAAARPGLRPARPRAQCARLAVRARARDARRSSQRVVARRAPAARSRELGSANARLDGRLTN